MPTDSSGFRLPPLEWLRVFEMAARTENFSAAAVELNLTQAAVSQRIRNLENSLGTPLFIRLPRGVRLTVEGESYAPHVRAALTQLERSTSDLFGAPRSTLTIAGTATVIDRWITPRLPALRSHYPELLVTLVTMHTSDDYTAARADFEVRFGEGVWHGRQSRKLTDEVLAPVAAPDLIQGTMDSWRSLPQIAVSGPRDGWHEWAASAGESLPREPLIRFDSFALALNAAVGGNGILLGSLELIAEELASGKLVRLPAPAVRIVNGYWLTWLPEAEAHHSHFDIVEILSN